MPNSSSFPLQIGFRDIAPSPSIEARVQRYAEKLGRFHPHIMSCRVIVSAPERGHHHRRLYLVRIHIALPRTNLWINRASPQTKAHANVYVALRDAFAAAVRRLEDFSRRQSGRIKRHSEPRQGGGAQRSKRPRNSTNP
jgi:hypothetical protein